MFPVWRIRAVSIPGRLRMAFAVLTLLLLLGSLVGLWHYRNVTLLTSRMSRSEQRLAAVLRLNNQLLTLVSHLHQAADRQDRNSFQLTAARLLQSFEVQTHSVGPSLEEIAHDRSRSGTLAVSILALLESLPGRIASLTDLAKRDDWTVIHARLLNQADQTDEILAELMTELDSDLSEERKRVAEDLASAGRRALVTLATTAVLSLAIALLLTAVVTQSVKAPLEQLATGARALAEGKFDHRIPIDGQDELAELANGFNLAAGELQHLFSELQHEKAVSEAARTELAERARELARANADLEQFAYSASHDLQEPLRTITLYSQFLRRRWTHQLSAGADECVEFMYKSAQHMQQLISDLLDFTRAGHLQPTMDLATDANLVLEKVLGILRVQIEEQGGVVQADPLPVLRAHETHVQQLLQNLIGNAIRYRSEERAPRIAIRAARRDSMWELSVQDNGIGIEKEYTTQIFGIFRRLHSRKYSGTGVGLAICQRIVERYGGSIWVESEPGRSSTFFFTLPAASRENDVPVMKTSFG